MNKNLDPVKKLSLRLRGGWETLLQLKFFQTSGIFWNESSKEAHIRAAGQSERRPPRNPWPGAHGG